MADNEPRQAKREYAQLIALHARIQSQLERLRDDLVAPGTNSIVKDIKARTGTAPDLSDIITAVEETIRTFQLSESSLRSAVDVPVDTVEVEGINNLPAHLQRFLAERAETPGFAYEVLDDEVRGWIIRWKEYTHRGTIRGYGQFCERPHAWLDD